MADQINSSEAKLIAGTVTARPLGFNYKISALVDVNGKRTRMWTFRTLCEQGFGRLSFEDYSDLPTIYNPTIYNLQRSGTTHSDKLFDEICTQGMPSAYRQMNNDKR